MSFKKFIAHLNMGAIDSDKIFSIFLINALDDQFGHLIQALTQNSNFSTAILIQLEMLLTSGHSMCDSPPVHSCTYYA
jgi:hypothetical protein